MKVVVLLSGGLDSATAMYQAIADGADEVMAVSCMYGAKHEEREIGATHAIVHEAGMQFAETVIVEQTIVQLPAIFSGGKSALMGDVEMPKEEYRDYDSKEGESVTVVPFRNANLISAAVSIAEVLEYDKVYVGMHATDHGTWAYPDCTPEFLGPMAAAVYVGTNHRVRLVFPFLWMTKTEVVTRAVLLEVPIVWTYSCYEGRVKHCGKCPTCLERIKAFIEAGYADPAGYEVPTPAVAGLERIR